MSRVLISDVKRAVCAVYGITMSDIERYDRHPRFVGARQMAMAVAREITGQSWPQLVRSFKRHESTVKHGVAQVAAQKAADVRELATFQEVIRLARAYSAGESEAAARFFPRGGRTLPWCPMKRSGQCGMCRRGRLRTGWGCRCGKFQGCWGARE